MAEKHPSDPHYRAALERTVPSASFTAEATHRELEATLHDLDREITPDRFLHKTIRDSEAAEATDTETSVDSFGDTTGLPEELRIADEQPERRFEVIGQIGHGATSRVYAVRDLGLDRTIALKLFRQARKNKEENRERFVYEARVTAHLEHPNIMPIHDIGVSDSRRVYFTMKNVNGMSVGHAIRAQREGGTVPEAFRTIEDKIRTVLKVCDGLAFAHSRGFIHQDIKPDNIMLGEFGEVLLLDWGCALSQGETSGRKPAGAYGTPAYMSPEQARREGVDQRSDIYCLCATLFHMLTLRHPTWADDPETFWEKKRAGVVDEVTEEEQRHVPASLLDFVRKGMTPDPADRYQSVVELREGLLEYQAHAESIALAESAVRSLAQSASPDYHLFANVTARLEQALEMWPGNDTASTALQQTRRAHAAAALDRGDTELAADIVGHEDTFADLRQRIDRARASALLRRRRSRRAWYAAAVLAALVIAAAAYFGYDYYQRFGKWQQVYHRDFTDGDTTVDDLAFSLYDLTDDENPILPTASGLRLTKSTIMWLRNVRERGDVRVEVVARWPETVDGLEILLASRRENPDRFYWVPTGYACQFGGWDGTTNVISRNDRPRQLGTATSVASELEPRRTYRLWFQRVGDRVGIFVEGRCVLETVEALPMTGDSLDRIAIRAWDDVDLQSVTVWRMGSAAKPHALVVGDALVRRNDLEGAVEEYLRVAGDLRETPVEIRGLLKAYLVAAKLNSDSIVDRQAIRSGLEDVAGGSATWATVMETDALALWEQDRPKEAFVLAAEVLDRFPDSRIALRMLDTRPNPFPSENAAPLLELLGRTQRVASLTLNDMGIEDLSPLRGMRLRRLDCVRNRITSLEPLRGMPLSQLLAQQNRIADLEPLRGMPLEQLSVAYSKVVSLEPLRGMPLVYLAIGANQVADLSPLNGMPLEFLSCHHNELTTLNGIEGLPLTRLEVEQNSITSLEPVRGMPLRELRMDRNQITDLSPLRGMPLERLGCEANGITDISVLADLPLKELYLGYNNIGSLSALHGLKLRILNAGNCGLGDVEPLRGMPLQFLDAGTNNIASLEPLAGAPLRELKINRNPISSLAPLRGMRLGSISLMDCMVRDLRPLAGMPLTWVSALGSPLADLAPFEESPPDQFEFDTVRRGRAYVDRILAAWELNGDSTVAHETRVLRAAREQDWNELLSLATPFQGHRYLFVPVFLAWEKGRELARKAGGHLVTVGSAEENAFVYALLPPRRGVWLGMQRSIEQIAWTTGEPVTFTGFFSENPPDTLCPSYMVPIDTPEQCWYDADRPELCSVVIEWDG